MRIATLIATLFLFSFQETISQCDFINSLDIIDAVSVSIAANAECTDTDGWTHYYNSDENLLLISVKKNGQDIGDLSNGLNITSSTRADYGNIGFNLSNADYIFNEVWLVANRSWQMTGATPITDPIQVRFYVNNTDFEDIVELQQSLGITFSNEFDKLNMYTVSDGNALDAYATSTQPSSANFTLYDMAPGASPDWMSGTQNNFLFGEYETNTTDIAGSIGILFFVNSPAVAISGNITKPNAAPVPNVNVSVPGGTTVVSDAGGNYLVPGLNIDFDYQLIPSKNINYLEDVSATDLIRLSRHLAGIDDLDTPFQFIAADTDNDTDITQTDLLEIMNLILGEQDVFPNVDSWRFVPQSYTFPNPVDPFTPPFPESISIDDLADSLFNQNFTGVKIGDVGEASLNPPPPLNTAFILPEVGTCTPDEEIIFEMSVDDFEGLRGFQFTLEWDKDVMSFVSVDNINLMGLLPQNIGTGSVDDGFLTFVWFNPAQMGTTLMDGEVVCELRFITTGNVNDTTPLNFTSSITEALVVYQNMSEDVPIFINGNTTIGNNSGIGATALVTSTDCDGNAIGSIDLTVVGAVPPITYEWSNGEMSEDIDMLPANTYTVTITDSSGECPKIASFEVKPGGQFDVLADVMSMSCPAVLNGSIDLNISGGASPFTYQWSNGEDTEIIDGLYEGMYDVTVTDAIGCTQTASFEVENTNRIFPVVTVLNSNNVGAANGSIMISEIVGGFPPFAFQWSNGDTTQSIMDVPPGNYAVTITDEIGCGHVFGYLVHDLMVNLDETNGINLKAGIFPNPMPVNAHFTIAVETPVSGQAEAIIFTTNGQVLNRLVIPLQEGMNQHQLPTPVVSGLYFIQLFYENRSAGWLKMMVR